MLKSRFKLTLLRLRYKLKDGWDWLWAHLVTRLLSLIGYLPASASIKFFARLARLIGPLTPRHKIALANLRAAYPEKKPAELRAIANEMWSNMGRLFAEYVFLDKIFDFDPTSRQPGLIEVEGIDIFLALREEKSRPHIFFTIHSGNFELLPICAASFDLEVTALFRPPNNPYIAKRVLRARRTKMGHLVPSKAGSAFVLAGKLQKGGNIGALIDQKFRRGIAGTFFNRPVKTNPLVPKLARQFDCDIYPARCIRLAGGRYRLELHDKLDLARGENGSIDVVAVTQQLNDLAEIWIREYPGQWMWFHRRWGNGHE